MTKKYYLQGGLYLVITAVYITLVVWLGIPLAVKIAELVVRDKGGGNTQPTNIILPPRLNYLPSATNSAELQVSGYAPANQMVEVFLNTKKEVETTANAEGYFVNDIILTLGANQIYALTKDQKGEKSGMSNTLTISYLDIAPELTITEPIDKQEIKQKDNYVNVQGNTEAGLTLKVNGRLGIIGVDGSFSYRLGLSEGENTILVEVIDSAGNKKEQKVVINYKKR